MSQEEGKAQSHRKGVESIDTGGNTLYLKQFFQGIVSVVESK